MLTTDAGESPLLAAVADAVHAGRAALQAVGGLGRQAGTGVITRSAATARLMLSEATAVAVFREFAILDEGAAAIRFAPAVFDLDQPPWPRCSAAFHTPIHRGQLREHSRYISLDSTSPELLRQTQLLLLAFGIKARLYEDTRLAEATAARPHPTQSLRISRASCPLFEQAIGFHAESPKAQALTRLNGEEPVTGEELTDEVVAIEPAGEADVFDLTERSPTTSWGGLVVHNCSEYLFLATPRAISPPSPGEVPHEDGTFEGRLPPRLPLWTRCRDHRADGRLSSPRSPAELGLPHHGPWLRNMGNVLLRRWPPTIPRRRLPSRRETRSCAGGLRDLGEMRVTWGLPATQEPGHCCA